MVKVSKLLSNSSEKIWGGGSCGEREGERIIKQMGKM